MCKKCSFPDGIVIKPDGVNDLDPCIYTRKEIHKNVTVFVDQCVNCGHVSIGWESQDNTESIVYEELAEFEEEN